MPRTTRLLRFMATLMAVALLFSVASPLVRQACAQRHHTMPAHHATPGDHTMPAHHTMPPDHAVPAPCLHAGAAPTDAPVASPCCFMTPADDAPATVTKPVDLPALAATPTVIVAATPSPPLPPVFSDDGALPAAPCALHLLHAVFLR